MIKISMNTKGLWKLKSKQAFRMGLINTTLSIQSKIREKMPYKTWKLIQSVKSNPAVNNIWSTTKQIRIWPSVPYWKAREFKNYKNPHKRFYIRRTLKEWQEIADKEITNALKKFYG